MKEYGKELRFMADAYAKVSSVRDRNNRSEICKVSLWHT